MMPGSRARALAGVLVMATLIVVYLLFTGVRAVALLGSGTPLAIAMGAALLLLPLVGVWGVANEILFGARATKLVDRLSLQDGLPAYAEFPETVETVEAQNANQEKQSAVSSPRLLRAAKYAPLVARYEEETVNSPGSWQAWLRLGLTLDASGSRGKARRAVRTAIKIERNTQ